MRQWQSIEYTASSVHGKSISWLFLNNLYLISLLLFLLLLLLLLLLLIIIVIIIYQYYL